LKGKTVSGKAAV